MKILQTFLLILFFAVFSGCKSIQSNHTEPEYTFSHSAELTSKREKVNPSRSELMRTTWFRNGVEILVQNDANKKGVSICMISPFKHQKRGVSLVVFFKNSRLSSVSGGPGLTGCSFAIDDFTRDGIPDTIQITNINHSKVIEAYSIAAGIVEPIPSHLFHKDRSEFYFDDEVVEHLKR